MPIYTATLPPRFKKVIFQQGEPGPPQSHLWTPLSLHLSCQYQQISELARNFDELICSLCNKSMKFSIKVEYTVPHRLWACLVVLDNKEAHFQLIMMSYKYFQKSYFHLHKTLIYQQKTILWTNSMYFYGFSIALFIDYLVLLGCLCVMSFIIIVQEVYKSSK